MENEEFLVGEDIQKFENLVRKQRNLTEMFKKGEPEGIDVNKFLKNQLEILNAFESLLGAPLSYWAKNENGEWFLASGKGDVQ